MARSNAELAGCLVLNLVYDLPSKGDVFTKKVYMHADHYDTFRRHLANQIDLTNGMVIKALAQKGIYISPQAFSTHLTTIHTTNLLTVQNTGRFPSENR